MTRTKDSLQARIQHARSTTKPLPDLVFRDIPRMVTNFSENDDTFLIYVSSNDVRTRLTYKEFYALVMETAVFLISKGIGTGDRIATISHNHWHTVVHYYAAWLLGSVVVPVNLGEDDSRIAYILEKAEIKLALIRSEYADRISTIIFGHGLNHIESVLCDESIDGFTNIEGGMKEARALLSGVDQAGDYSQHDALIVFTSGTTGNPKGVVLTQQNLLEDARAISEWHKIDRSTRMMCVLPIHHVNGTVVTLLTPFFAGASVVLNEKFRVARFFSLAAEENVHIVSVVPTLLQFLNSEYSSNEPYPCPDLRHIICGAGPLTVSVAENFEKRFGIRIIHGYGLSETTCYSCYLPLSLSDMEHEGWMRDHGYPSIGVALDVNEMDIHDTLGRPVPDGQRGEIVIRGYNVMKGYYANEEANEQAFTYGWFRSGDEGFTLADKTGRRFYFITGRIKELIIRGGVNLAPLEIDEVICRAPGVKTGISVGFENDWYGEEVGAYVQLEEGVETDAESIISFCRKHLPFSKCPKVIVFGNQIPVTSTGKYQRMKIAHLFKEWKGVQFRK